jgi:hypothetical protein
VLTRAARSAVAMGSTIGSALLRKGSGLFFAPEWWHLAYRTSREHFVANAPSLTREGFVEIECGTDRFHADPIAISFDGTDVVFFEEYVYAEGRGVISCATLDEHGILGKPHRVLERPYHLSYPFVFVHEGVPFMIPETFANETIELYRCTRFPDEWTFEKTLLAGLTATDATLHHDGTRWWMFVTVGEQGSYTWDELQLFMADSPFGPWRPHPRNPVKCDARSARPAGPLFRRDGKLIRPTQDCSQIYGGAIHLCEIEVLTPDDYRERVVDRIAPDWFRNADGLHTLTATERIEVVDVRTPRRFRWAPLT